MKCLVYVLRVAANVGGVPSFRVGIGRESRGVGATRLQLAPRLSVLDSKNSQLSTFR